MQSSNDQRDHEHNREAERAPRNHIDPSVSHNIES